MDISQRQTVLTRKSVNKTYLKLGLVVLDKFIDRKEIDGVKLVIHRAPVCTSTYTAVSVVAPDQIMTRNWQWFEQVRTNAAATQRAGSLHAHRCNMSGMPFVAQTG